MYTVGKISPEKARGDWKEASAAMADYVESIYDFDKIDIPTDGKKEIKMYGSGWGAFESRFGAVSDICTFPEESLNEKQAEWLFLLENGYLAENDGVNPPVSYVTDAPVLEMLEKSMETKEGNHWYTLYHIGIIRYKQGDIEGALSAWKQSAERKKTPWNLRNIAMVYKNDKKDPENAVRFMREAIEETKGNECRGLIADAGALYTTCGADDAWLALFDTLSPAMRAHGRLQLYSAVAHLHCGEKEKAEAYINEDFLLSDIKEGELSVSALWGEIYGDTKPLPAHLDFRMHE